MSQTLAIETEQLRREFGRTVAVKGLTLQVQRGEVFGFLGPNGAGKTTSIKMLLGLIAPTSGSARLLGAPLNHLPTRARLGFLPEHFRFHDWLSAVEFLTLHGRLYGMKGAEIPRRIDELLELVGLAPFRQKQLRTFSKGMLQRVGLAQALMNQPDLVFLDEPTSGLDPVGRRLVRDIIRQLRQQGACVFLNSHILSEIELVCDRVAFIKFGEVVRVLDLKNNGLEQVNLTIRARGFSQPVLDLLAQAGSDLRLDGEQASLVLPSEAGLPDLTRALVALGLDIYAITPQRASLEDQFIQIVGTDGGL